jgi:hypothetical protein
LIRTAAFLAASLALEGSVSAALIHRQQRPVLIIPEPGNQPAR